MRCEIIRTSYAGDSHYGANEEASPCAPVDSEGGSGRVAPLTDRDLATARGRSIGGSAVPGIRYQVHFAPLWKHVQDPCAVAGRNVIFLGGYWANWEEWEGLGCGEEGGGEGGDAFGASGEAEVLGGGGFYGDAVEGDAEVLSYVGSHLLDVGEHFGSLGDDGDVDVGYGVAFFTDEAQALAQK